MTKLFTNPKMSLVISPIVPLKTEYVWDNAKDTDIHSLYKYPIPREVALDVFTVGKWLPAYSLQELLDWVYTKSSYIQSDIELVANCNTAQQAAEHIMKIERKK